MDRYIVFSACNIFDMQTQLNMNAANGYVLALMEIQDSQNQGLYTQYIVIMEYQPVQSSQVEFPPFNVKKEKEKEGTTDDADS